eukprot:5511260-Amphidinium_carterae.1
MVTHDDDDDDDDDDADDDGALVVPALRRAEEEEARKKVEEERRKEREKRQKEEDELREKERQRREVEEKQRAEQDGMLELCTHVRVSARVSSGSVELALACLTSRKVQSCSGSTPSAALSTSKNLSKLFLELEFCNSKGMRS